MTLPEVYIDLQLFPFAALPKYDSYSKAWYFLDEASKLCSSYIHLRYLSSSRGS